VYVVQFLAGAATIVILVEAFGVPPWLAALGAIAVTVPVTFVLSRALLKPPRRER
jgi:putative flippase GtrA